MISAPTSRKDGAQKTSSSPGGCQRGWPPTDIFKSTLELNATTVNFLKIDLDTALTFAQIALQAQDSEKRERNRHNARLGYDTVLRLLPRVSPVRADAEIMAEKLDLLKADLMELGETF